MGRGLYWDRQNECAGVICMHLRAIILATFTTGYGDGCYATYIGFDKEGHACQLLTDFELGCVVEAVIVIILIINSSKSSCMLRPFYHIYFIFFFLTVGGAGQGSGNRNDLVGKIFIGPELEYIKFINDSTLRASVNLYNDTAIFRLIGIERAHPTALHPD